MKKKLENALADLDKAFESLEVQPLSNDDLSRVAGGTIGNCVTEGGATCNWKCGNTSFWECPSDFGQCNTSENNTDIFISGCEFTDTPGFPGCL